jgi:hypothetical protein
MFVDGRTIDAGRPSIVSVLHPRQYFYCGDPTFVCWRFNNSTVGRSTGFAKVIKQGWEIINC